MTNKSVNIKLLISDVDGVFTDGTILIGSDGTEFKSFSVEDGAGVAFARLANIPVALISGRYSPCTSRRIKELGIEHCYQGKLNKIDRAFVVLKNAIAFKQHRGVYRKLQ